MSKMSSRGYACFDEVHEVHVIISLEDLAADNLEQQHRQASPGDPPPLARYAEDDSAHGTVAKEIIISRPVADVFAVVADIGAYPAWISGLQSVEITERDETSGLATLACFTAGAMGITITYTLRYTATENDFGGKKLAWRSIGGGVKSIVGQYDLSPVDENATRVAYSLDVDTGFAMPALLRRTAIGLIVGAALPDLKKHVESGGKERRRSSWFG